MSTNPTAAATLPLTPEQESKIYKPEQEWSDDFALKVVVQDFNAAEVFRTAQHDWRWRTHFSLYEAFVEQKVWEGSRIPRSSLPIYLCFEQVESMLPKILSAIFADNPWFQAEPERGTTADEARQVRDHIISQMDQTQVREVLRRWLKSGLIHGNGIMGLSWLQKQTVRQKYRARWETQTRMVINPQTGQPQPMASGFKRSLQLVDVTEIENRPKLDFVLLTDFYIDPNCPSPSCQDARYAITRHLLDVDEVDQLRKNKEFKIPPKEMLIQMAKYKPSAQGDVTKSSSETARLGFWQPSMDQTADPGGKRIEALCYWTKDRCAYVLNREWVSYNTINPYGFMPFYDFPYADVLGRFYSMGMCDVLEGEQRFRQSLRNGRVDEIALNIHRPMVKRRNMTSTTFGLRQRPGQILEADNPKEDFVFPDPPNVLQSAYIEDNYSQAEAQKITGLTDLVASGMPQSGGNSASRTATGVGAQVTAGNSRIQYLVENAEDMGIEPMLRDVWILNNIYPPLEQQGQNMEPQTQIKPEVIINSNIKFRMRASAKMRARQALMQTLPLVMQTMMNPALIQELRLNGETLNMKEFMRMVLDMTGYETLEDLVRKLTPQEMQQMNQPPADAMIKMQMQKERLASQEKTTGQKLAAQSESQDNADQSGIIKSMLPHMIKGLLEEPKSAAAKP